MSTVAMRSSGGIADGDGEVAGQGRWSRRGENQDITLAARRGEPLPSTLVNRGWQL